MDYTVRYPILAAAEASQIRHAVLDCYDLRDWGSARGATSIFVRCPVSLDANEWYARRGFACEGQEWTRGKKPRQLNLWRLDIA